MPFKNRLILSALIGILAGVGTFFLPVSTIYNRAHLGDLCPPLFGIRQFTSGMPAYEGHFFNSLPVIAYPFTTMLALYPFSFIPIDFIGPLFFSISSAVFSYALLFDGKLWRILVLLSPAYIFSLHSIQFVPLLASALVLPYLLPLAAIKPQLGIVLLASGKWNTKLFIVFGLFIILSFIIYPNWLTDWLYHGNLSQYKGTIPMLHGFGFLLVLSLLKWKDRRSRILAAMAVIPQRLWYDQLMLFFIPQTKFQLGVLLFGSWLSFFLSMHYGWLFKNDLQDKSSWMIFVNFVYLPSLIMIYIDNLHRFNSWIKLRLSSYKNRLFF